jgi:hypothetical protein
MTKLAPQSDTEQLAPPQPRNGWIPNVLIKLFPLFRNPYGQQAFQATKDCEKCTQSTSCNERHLDTGANVVIITMKSLQWPWEFKRKKMELYVKYAA